MTVVCGGGGKTDVPSERHRSEKSGLSAEEMPECALAKLDAATLGRVSSGRGGAWRLHRFTPSQESGCLDQRLTRDQLLGPRAALSLARPATWVFFHSIHMCSAVRRDERSHTNQLTRGWRPAPQLLTLRGRREDTRPAWALDLLEKSTQARKLALIHLILRPRERNDPEWSALPLDKNSDDDVLWW